MYETVEVHLPEFLITELRGLPRKNAPYLLSCCRVTMQGRTQVETWGAITNIGWAVLPHPPVDPDHNPQISNSLEL